MDGLQVDQAQHVDPTDDTIPLDTPCPQCDDGELVIDAGDVRCDTCTFVAA